MAQSENGVGWCGSVGIRMIPEYEVG